MSKDSKCQDTFNRKAILYCPSLNNRIIMNTHKPGQVGTFGHYLVESSVINDNGRKA